MTACEFITGALNVTMKEYKKVKTSSSEHISIDLEHLKKLSTELKRPMIN